MSQELKILHTESSPHWGGQEIRIFNECCWMEAQGHEVHLVIPMESQLAEKAKSKTKWTLHFCDFKNKVGAFWQLYKLLKKENPHVINTHSNIDSKLGLLAAKFTGVPVKVRSRHVSNPINNKVHNRYLYGKLADHVLTTGDCISREITGKLGVDPEKVQTIATGIAPPVLIERTKAKKQLYSKLGLDESNRLIGVVSVLRSWKGHDLIFKSLKKLNQENLHLVLAGDGPYAEPLKDMVKDLGLESHVHFLGYCKDVYPILRALDLAMLTSVKNEGIPQSLIQAMYCETPVLGSDVGGIPELLSDGQYGQLVKGGDVDSLYEGLKEFLNKGHSKVVQAARKHIEDHYLIDKMGKDTLSVYQKYLKV